MVQNMKIPKVTMFRMVSHDFWRSMRAWKNDMEPRPLIEMLTQQRQKSLATALRGSFIALVATLWIVNSEVTSTMPVDSFGLKLNIPVAYIIFAISVLMFGVLTNFLSYLHNNEFLRLAINKYYDFENAVAFVAPFDGSSSWSMPVMVQFRFLQSTKTHKALTWLSLFAIFLPSLLTLLFVDGVVIAGASSIILKEYSSVLNVALSFTSIFLVLFPIFYAVFICVPVSFTKNVNFTRWNFLARKVHAGKMQSHPHVSRWLADGL
jgi:hypothetical protein